MNMEAFDGKALRVSFFDPTGNITALVEGPVAPEKQPGAAEEIMRRRQETEQVGFVRFPEGDGRVCLRMAGGEFCGNASMSAAALYLLRRKSESLSDGWETVRLAVSGTENEIEVRLKRQSEEEFSCCVRMPPALAIEETELTIGELRDRLSLVRMEGIWHVIVTPKSPLYGLLDDRTAAESAARGLCAAWDCKALGLLFLDGEGERRRLTPLVFVPGSGTVFWERSCASGSAAVGMALAARAGVPLTLKLSEPGGELLVESDPAPGRTLLYGRTRFIGEI